jgi:hypothetical protein
MLFQPNINFTCCCFCLIWVHLIFMCNTSYKLRSQNVCVVSWSLRCLQVMHFTFRRTEAGRCVDVLPFLWRAERRNRRRLRCVRISGRWVRLCCCCRCVVLCIVCVVRVVCEWVCVCVCVGKAALGWGICVFFSAEFYSTAASHRKRKRFGDAAPIPTFSKKNSPPFGGPHASDAWRHRRVAFWMHNHDNRLVGNVCGGLIPRVDVSYTAC